ncbi:MAG: hypothetical protein HUJ98_13870, partial [Bacteroidaceae bacterium]|nr:hypothetical protein [Bacteroidaceae bacterium]
MSLISKFVSRYKNYVEYICSEQYYKHQFLTRSELLMHDTLHLQESGVSDEAYFDSAKVIVSLTTYEKRIDEVYLTIESLLQQT